MLALSVSMPVAAGRRLSAWQLGNYRNKETKKEEKGK